MGLGILLGPLLPAELRLRVFPGNVVNINPDREVTRADVDRVRDAFQKLGWTEVESWLPRQGVSWLSDGVSAGVSFRVEIP